MFVGKSMANLTKQLCSDLQLAVCLTRSDGARENVKIIVK